MSPGWLRVREGSPFPVANLPYGAFSRNGGSPRVGCAIGDFVIDLAPLLGDEVFAERTLNDFMAQGPQAWGNARATLVDLLTDEAHRGEVEPHLIPLTEVVLHRPFDVADYVDFYASEHHATNLGKIFRPGSPPLTPNWKHLPLGYHGRAGTVVVSGTAIRRPHGQRKRPDDAEPSYGPSRRLDIEAEVGFVVGVGSDPGTTVATDAFEQHVFGVVLVNDWSARDIQAFEYVPLGPFLGKSFATSISPWVVPLQALTHARVAHPPQHPIPLGYLRDDPGWGLDIDIEIEWNGSVVARPRFRHMYWTAAQQLAHMTANGASLRTGDLFASGTISGPNRDERGSFIELSWNGSEPVTLGDGSTRSFLEDGDTVTIRATAPGERGVRIGFGEVAGTIVP